MVTFVSLHRGQDVPSAKPIAVTLNPQIVARVAAWLLDEREDEPDDPALIALESGRKTALRVIAGGAE